MEQINSFSFKTYSSNINGFSIDYPEKWLISENQPFFVVGFRESNEETYPSFNVQIMSMSGTNLTQQNFEEMIRSQILSIGAKSGQFTDERVGEFNGRSIIFYIPDSHMKSKQTYFFNGDNAYIISYTNKADDYFTQHLFVHDHAISSFALIQCKGYKFLQLKSNLAQLTQNKNDDKQSLFIEYYIPKQWVAEKISKSTTKYLDNSSSNNNNSLTLQILPSSSTNDNNSSNSGQSLEKYINSEFSDKLVTSTINKTIQLNNFIYDFGKKISIQGKQVEWRTNKQESVSVVFEFDQAIVSLTFSTPLDELKHWRAGFNRIIEYFGLINNQNKKAKENVPYDIFDNVLIGYSCRVPKSFEITNSKPSGEYVSFQDTEDKTPIQIPYCFRVLVEDLTEYPGQLKLYEYSNEVISKLLEQPEATLLTNEPGFIRLDKHLAQTSSMQYYDSELQDLALRLIVTSVQKNHGIVLFIRTLKSPQFDFTYKKSFYIFDTFNFYKIHSTLN